MKGRHKKWLGYCLYGIGLTLALLYYRFPSEAVRDFLLAKAGSMAPGIRVSLGEVSPSLRFGLRLRDIEIAQRRGTSSPALRLEEFFIRPAVRSFVQGQLEWCFEGSFYGGVVKGCIRLNGEGLEKSFATTILLEHVVLDQKNPLVGLAGRPVEGTLGGEIFYEGPPGPWEGGRGKADLAITGGRFELLNPVLGLESIDFGEVRLRATLDDGKIMLGSLDLRGKQMHGTMSGEVYLNRDIIQSRLNLKGTLEPYSGFFKEIKASPKSMSLIKKQLKKGKLPFLIQGTIAEPIIRFL
ncbi:MAG: type II secretion system protein GspN [Deltaproteobacteria bacterium]|nr:type II secretion system protein GspN [Deltaproteobacteria bacterium]